MPSAEPQAAPAFPRALPALFATTVGVGAALAFGVQPLAARALLPSYGGSSSVWTLCLLFFQAALLLGYGWAHGSLRVLTLTRQAPLQIGLVALAAIVAARLPPLLREPSPDALSSSLLVALASGVGLPFVVLATGSPLLSRWYAAAAGHGEASRDVYWLYAASNAGSLGSLLAYPLLIEGRWPLSRQFELFRFGLWVYLALVVVSFVALLTRAGRGAGDAREAASPQEANEGAAPEAPPTFRRRLTWMAIAAVPASLLSSVTAHLTTDMASSPLLWVVPLALYLASFIFIYRDRPWVSVERASQLVPIVALSALLIYLGRVPGPATWILVSGLALTFSSALLAHGLLYRDRPGAAHLTDFYLCGSIGGALGGAFNALVAPRVFDDLHELPLGVLGLLALRMMVPAPAPTPTTEETEDPGTPVSPRHDAIAVALVLAVGLGAVLVARALALPPEVRSQPLVFLAVPAVIGFAGRSDARRYLATSLALVLVGFVARAAGTRSSFEARSFYGPLRVETLLARDGTDARVLRHGITLHGIQSNDPQRAETPGAYYHGEGPVGDVLRAFHARGVGDEPPRIGAVGLGVGTVAAYARPEERWVFFELDPLVTKVAETPALFTYLRDARARGADVRTVAGDARQHLLRERDGSFSFLILDAFSSDAIPLHLITREALAAYAKKLAPRGFLLLHLSNLHLDLPPIVAATAHELGAALRCRNDAKLSPAAVDQGHWPSIWCVIFPHAGGAAPEEILPLAAGVWTAPTRAKRGWTDDRANVLDAVRSPFDSD